MAKAKAGERLDVMSRTTKMKVSPWEQKLLRNLRGQLKDLDFDTARDCVALHTTLAVVYPETVSDHPTEPSRVQVALRSKAVLMLQPTQERSDHLALMRSLPWMMEESVRRYRTMAEEMAVEMGLAPEEGITEPLDIREDPTTSREQLRELMAAHGRPRH